MYRCYTYTTVILYEYWRNVFNLNGHYSMVTFGTFQLTPLSISRSNFLKRVFIWTKPPYFSVMYRSTFGKNQQIGNSIFQQLSSSIQYYYKIFFEILPILLSSSATSESTDCKKDWQRIIGWIQFLYYQVLYRILRRVTTQIHLRNLYLHTYISNALNNF